MLNVFSFRTESRSHFYITGKYFIVDIFCCKLAGCPLRIRASEDIMQKTLHALRGQRKKVLYF